MEIDGAGKGDGVMRLLVVGGMAIAILFGNSLAWSAGALQDFAWQADWSCGQAVAPECTLVQGLLDAGALHGYTVNGVDIPVLVGEQMEGVGTVAFIQRAGQWQLYPVAEGHRVEGAYSTPASDRFMLFTLWGTEGPGAEYTVLRGKGQFAGVGCVTVAFPAGLNQPVWANEYLALEGFNIRMDGSGTLIGSVYHERGGNGSKDWYRYTTNDWGKTWGRAVQVDDTSNVLAGVFLPAIKVKPSSELLDSLLGSVPK